MFMQPWTDTLPKGLFSGSVRDGYVDTNCVSILILKQQNI